MIEDQFRHWKWNLDKTQKDKLMTILSVSWIFLICVVLMTISSFVLGGSLDTLKARFHVSGGLLGMLAALGAATPEISSAATALFVKQHDVGVGIIIGSNIFNLAALLALWQKRLFFQCGGCWASR